ncbi:response regulator [Marinobacterium arenosum]|uniref:response regulator n=1 Tax=Marinobacterium arenosum TaxID=2862496 RepID=UPI001C96831C|nr:response regulator [Marinobacterium arenosum]MBY4677136.1 response regulator [Marinobacterium arenosum]
MNKDINILIVDDFSTMRRIIKKALTSIEFKNFFEATDGLEALDTLQSKNIDFLVTDWNMPNMSGLELVKEIRANSRLATIPILMVTAEAKREQIVQAAMAGVNGYIIKPFSAITLQEKVKQIFKRIEQNNPHQ